MGAAAHQVADRIPHRKALFSSTFDRWRRIGWRLVGLAEDFDVSSLSIADFHPAQDAGRIVGEALPAVERSGAWSGETRFRSFADGSPIPVLQVLLAHRGEDGAVQYFSTIARDLRPHLESEELLRATEAQLRQAQKMDAVGRLAGGIAHDFNNMLTIMLGFSDIVIAKLGRDHPAHHDVVQIRKAGRSAAALTRQLLAFSRRQVAERRIVDPNPLISNLEPMLRQLIGESPSMWSSRRTSAGSASIRASSSRSS